jgi:hypothetical protein
MPAADAQNDLQCQPSGGGVDAVLDMISCGVPFRLTASSPELLDLMRRHVPHGTAACAAIPSRARNFSLRAQSGAGYQVLADAELLLNSEALASALFHMSGHLMIYVAEHAPDFVFVHAGVVAWKDRALLLPGVSHAGKSTLVAELVRAGATYYSDEFALLDARGRVHPFARDLRLRQSGKPDQRNVPVSQLNGHAGTVALTVARIVFTEYSENACFAPEPMSPGRAVLEMLLHTAPVQRTPSRVLATVSATVQNAVIWKSLRGEAVPAAQALLAAMDGRGGSA